MLNLCQQKIVNLVATSSEEFSSILRNMTDVVNRFLGQINETIAQLAEEGVKNVESAELVTKYELSLLEKREVDMKLKQSEDALMKAEARVRELEYLLQNQSNVGPTDVVVPIDDKENVNHNSIHASQQ